MGRGIAALAASAGIPVLLLDIPGDEDRDGPAKSGLRMALDSSPPAFLDPGLARLVETGNTEDDLNRLADCEWVVEAIPERPDLKQSLFARIEEVTGDGTAVTSNTSGIPISILTEGRGEGFRRRFFGTHFFNPPRVMHLLEIIAGPETDSAVIDAVEAFADRVLGKGIVHAKDVPGFIANRLGIFGMVRALQLTDRYGLGIAEVDALTGPLLGRPASAVFRTADLVGLDVLSDAAAGIAAATGENLDLPDWARQLIEKGHLGAKTGAGFYRKEEGEILELDTKKGSWRSRELPEIEGLKALLRRPLEERLEGALALPDPWGAFLRSLLAGSFHYTLERTPEIAFDLPSVDRAMEWGFGWEKGPFLQMDLLGVDRVRELLEAEDLDEPELFGEVIEGFYRREGVEKQRVLQPGGGYRERPRDDRLLTAAALRESGKVLQENGSAALLDAGDGVALFEFRSRMGTLGDEVVRLLLESLEKLDREGWAGLVVGHDDSRAFSAGANLKELLAAAREGRWEETEGWLRAFQSMVLSLRKAPFPVVAAPFGLTLAGGAELVLHCDQVQSHAELQMGLVEAGVGLLPAGGGTKELLFRFSRALEAGGAEDAPVTAVRSAFRLIATAEVSTSSLESRRKGWLRDRDRITWNRDRLLSEAREQVLLLAPGYVPPPEENVMAPGDRAFGDLLVMIQAQREAGRASEHDALVAREVAWVLCGGDGAPRRVSEREMMELEREAFLRLLGTGPTIERIEYMLANGKPLRN
jgi:3-hydroxyacyl-CoA dehydrogenase